jgi:hypothetical protein
MSPCDQRLAGIDYRLLAAAFKVTSMDDAQHKNRPLYWQIINRRNEMSNYKAIAAILIAILATSATAAESPKIYIEDLGFSNLTITEPSDRATFPHRKFDLTEDELDGMNSLYRLSIKKEIAGKAGYQVVENAEEADFVVGAELLKLNPAAPKDDFHSRGGFEKYITKGAGSASIRFVVSKDGDAVLESEDRNVAGHDWRENDRFSNQQEVKRLFRSWSRSLVKQLQTIKG